MDFIIGIILIIAGMSVDWSKKGMKIFGYILGAIGFFFIFKGINT